MLIEYDKVYYARYMPKWYFKLNIFDQNPLFLKIEQVNGSMILGINLHWLPIPLRQKFIAFVIELSRRTPEKGRFRVFYQMIKRNPALSFALIAVRKYYIARLSNVTPIERENWDQLHILWASKYRARFLRRSISNPQKLHGAAKNTHFY